jgi:hypothetical protein
MGNHQRLKFQPKSSKAKCGEHTAMLNFFIVMMVFEDFGWKKVRF